MVIKSKTVKATNTQMILLLFMELKNIAKSKIGKMSEKIASKTKRFSIVLVFAKYRKPFKDLIILN